MKQVFIKQGTPVVEEVPAPTAAPGRVIVQTAVSCISVGTELSGLRASSRPLWKRAIDNPENVLKALRMMAEKGVGHTVQTVQGQLGAGLAVGYSLSGVVHSVGAGVHGFAPGDRVACAGAGYASHAEYVSVPENLTVPLPDNVSFEAASTVTLGAIAMQGVRRFDPTIGETVAVVGLGILGQITVQLLKANGCRVIGLDVDAGRVARALEAGADVALMNIDDTPVDRIASLTSGIGVDGVIVTAAAQDETLLNGAFSLCRRKGRVVLVGDVPITIDRSAIYRHELEFLISTSYGPGRYDESYEENGLDYPIGYVRWTENRNMAAFLGLIADNQIDPAGFIEARFPLGEARAAYDAISVSEGPRPLAVVLVCDDRETPASVHTTTLSKPASASGSAHGVGLVGASGFARAVHLPNMAELKRDFSLRAVCSQAGHNAKHVAEQFGAAYATTDFQEILDDADVPVVLIAGRHHLHADYVCRALLGGKHVFVEKPLALTREELARINSIFDDESRRKQVLMTGFNRRFSPAVLAVMDEIKDRTEPLVITYRMNAGPIPNDHWVQGPEGGGRNIGEACHIYDLFTALANADVKSVKAVGVGRDDAHMRRNENFSVVMDFADGSVASLTYSSRGNVAWPKEQMEVSTGGATFVIDDFKSAIVAGRKQPLWSGAQDKGHRNALVCLGKTLQNGGEWPIELWQQIQATCISLDVEDQLYAQASDES